MSDGTRPMGAQEYASPEYVSKGRLASYWHQVSSVLDLGARSTACIGPGNSLVPRWLRDLGMTVTTVDVLPSPAADVRGDVRQIPLRTGSVDVVLCPQVLEHLPWGTFDEALHELRRVCSVGAVVSLPHSRRRVQVRLDWRDRMWVRGVGLPVRGRLPIVSPEEHHWELDQPGQSVDEVVGRMTAAGFRLRQTYRVPEFDYHRFFVLAVN